ncbi:MAG: ribosome maturation factor RimM [Burkholderiaceae bacterium]
MSTVPSGAVDEPAWPADAIEVARIAGPWGVKGWFKVVPLAADPQAIFSARRWFIKPPVQTSAALPALRHSHTPQLLHITAAKTHGGAALAQAQGVEDRSGADALRGARVFVARSSFPTENADEFYWVDLIGLSVVNRHGQQLGSVIGLIDSGAQSVLRVAPNCSDATAPTAAPAERLIPFVAAYVDEVSLAQRCIKVDWELDY